MNILTVKGMQHRWKFALLLLVPLALYAFIDEHNSWRPKTLALESGYGGIVRYSPDGRYLAVSTLKSGMYDDLCIYDFNLRRILHTFNSVWLIGFPKADRLALWDYSTAHFCVYSLPNCQLLESKTTLPVGKSLEIELNKTAISPNGELSATYDSNLRVISLRDVQSGKVTRKLNTELNLLCGFDFSPDGRTLASGGADGTVKLWRIK